MIPSRRASTVYRDILGGKEHTADYYVKHCVKEIFEVLEALSRLALAEAYLELQQVIFGIAMWIYQSTGRDFYLWGCMAAVQEFYNRRKVWLEIFALYDLEFKSEYLDDGSNFRRPYKIKQALQKAGMYVNIILAENLSRKYTKYVTKSQTTDS